MTNEPLPIDEVLESPEDFEAVYEAHAPIIYRFLFWRTQNQALSEDLTSSVFEKAWRARTSFRGGSSKAWLLRIARNVLTDHWRKRADIPVEDMNVIAGADDRDMSEALDLKFQARELHKALRRLPEDMRRVVELRFIEGLSCREVAQELHLSESNVRVIQYRALKKLRGYLS
jgi:RNA polymerase sigma-70 factor (ECF subfamily)